MTIKVLQVDPGSDQEFSYETEAIAKAGGELIVGSATTEEDVLAQAGDAEIFWVSWLPIVTRRVMEQLPNVRLVMRWGVGYDQIPVKDATDLGIAVANAPAYGTDDVAEQAIALLVATARQVPWYHNQMVGGWLGPPARSPDPPHEGAHARRDRRRSDRRRGGPPRHRPRDARHRLRQVPPGRRAARDGRRARGDGAAAGGVGLRHDPHAAQRRDPWADRRRRAGQAPAARDPGEHEPRPGDRPGGADRRDALRGGSPRRRWTCSSPSRSTRTTSSGTWTT